MDQVNDSTIEHLQTLYYQLVHRIGTVGAQVHRVSFEAYCLQNGSQRDYERSMELYARYLKLHDEHMALHTHFLHVTGELQRLRQAQYPQTVQEDHQPDDAGMTLERGA